ncbi:hypothetical protein [Swaminathania salitolerans]|nr:hypothetical protein [Swaminathania salitolerans]
MSARSIAAFVASVTVGLAAPSAIAGTRPKAQIAPPATPSSSGSSAAETPAGKDVRPDAAITFAFQEVGGGLGYEWGKGTLRHNGRDYAFEIGGGGIASLGYVTVTGTGTVENLARLDKFDGTYWTVKADAAIGSGVGVAVLENQYGVKLHLDMTMKGAHLGASVMRLRFRLLPDGQDKIASR